MERDAAKQLAGQIRLIALDMDGTCLNAQGKMTLRTTQAIRALVEKEYIVVPATGRGFSGLRERTIGVPEIRYVISNNGAVVTDGRTGERLIAYDIPREVAANLSAAVLDQDTTCLHWDCGEDYSIPLPVGCRSKEMYERYFVRSIANECLGPLEMRAWVLSCGKRFYKMGLRFRGEYGFEHYEAMIARSFPQVDCLRSGDQIEVVRHGVNKGVALETLCAHLGIPPDQVCAIGDNGNDVAMIKYAGLGVAVENAIPDAKENAVYIAGHHDQDGAAQFLEDFFL